MLRREVGHVLRRALDHEAEGQKKKDRPMRTWKKQIVVESVKVGLRREDAFADQSGVIVIQIAVELR